MDAIGCQLSPDARALMRVSSSFADHVDADLVFAELEAEAEATAAVVVIDVGRLELADLTSFGMLIMRTTGKRKWDRWVCWPEFRNEEGMWEVENERYPGDYN